MRSIGPAESFIVETEAPPVLLLPIGSADGTLVRWIALSHAIIRVLTASRIFLFTIPIGLACCGVCRRGCSTKSITVGFTTTKKPTGCNRILKMAPVWGDAIQEGLGAGVEIEQRVFGFLEVCRRAVRHRES